MKKERKPIYAILLFLLAMGFIYQAQGLAFLSVTLLILATREAVYAQILRRGGVPYTLPYMLPMINAAGYLGLYHPLSAEDAQKETVIKASLWGPSIGCLVSAVFFVVGLRNIEAQSMGLATYNFVWGENLFTYLTGNLIHADVVKSGQLLSLSPIAAAGFCGLWINALALLPIGQLDGGHIAYALWGPRYVWVSGAFITLLFLIGLWTHPIWIMTAAYLLLFGYKHFKVESTSATPVKWQQRWLLTASVLSLLFFTVYPYQYKLF